MYDMHHPESHQPTLNCFRSFIRQNKVAGVVLGGDQFDFGSISHHNKTKIINRAVGSYKKELETFRDNFLDPLEKDIKAKSKKAVKVWILGNHERFEQDFVEENPEFKDMIDHVSFLKLKERGWHVIDMGKTYRNGKLTYLHGEWLTGFGSGGMYPAKKLVEVFAGSAVAGHCHHAQSFTRVSPVDHESRWMGWISPCACNLNPLFTRNRPKNWSNGWSATEFMPGGLFNHYQIIVSKKQCSYGGKVYKGNA